MPAQADFFHGPRGGAPDEACSNHDDEKGDDPTIAAFAAFARSTPPDLSQYATVE